MAGVNKEIIVGNVGKIDELKSGKNGIEYIKFSVAVTTGRKDNQVTEWFQCTAFGKTAQFASQYVGKGCKVYVEGRRQTTKDNQGRYWVDTIVENFQILDSSSTQKETSSDEPF